MTDPVDRGEIKMWLAVRADLEMPMGKLATQAGHGYVSSLMVALSSNPPVVQAYLSAAQPKITCTVPDEAALRRVAQDAEKAGLPHYLVTDAGRTVFDGPTATVVAVGPCYRDELPPFIKRLRLL